VSGFIDGIKKTVMIVISIFTMIFSFVLGTQTVLAKSADSLGLKVVRLALGSFVPIIGGTLSEALTTVKEGFSVIRSAAGITGILIILSLVLPTAVSLCVNSLILSFCHMTAEILGCSDSAKIIQGIKSVLTVLSTIVYATTLLFVIAMVLIAKSGTGGT
jgi:stage III sporulation protein AE